MIEENQLTRKYVTNFRYLKEGDVYKELNRAIICQCIDDLLNTSKKKESIEEKEEAEKWLFQDNDDLYEICENAGVDVRILRRSVNVLLKNYNVSMTCS